MPEIQRQYDEGSMILYRNYIFIVSKNLVFDTTKHKRFSLLAMF